MEQADIMQLRANTAIAWKQASILFHKMLQGSVTLQESMSATERAQRLVNIYKIVAPRDKLKGVI